MKDSSHKLICHQTTNYFFASLHELKYQLQYFLLIEYCGQKALLEEGK